MKTLKAAKAKAKRQGWLEFVKNEHDELAIREGCYYDVESANFAVAFYEQYLRHTMGIHAGKPFELLPWQKNDIIEPLFGWKREDGTNRFKKGFVWCAKKQGKSTISAGLAVLYLLTQGNRAEIYGVAHTREQAGIIYREAAAMVNSSPPIASRLKVLDSKKRIIFPSNGSFYQALAGEACARGVEGINPNLVLFDEIHAQRSRVLYDALAYASAARPNAMMLSVSTVGVADRTLIWWEQYEYTQKMLEGSIVDPNVFCFLAQADEECHDDFDKCGDPEQWRKAMPSLGYTVQEETIEQHYLEAKNSPAKQNAFRRYLLNLPTAGIEKVVNMQCWNVCTEDMPDLTGRECYGGLDLASHEDLSCYVLWFPATDEDPKSWVLPWFFVPSAKIKEREANGMAFYRQWRDEGHIHEAGLQRLDPQPMLDVVRATLDIYDVREIGFDPWGADMIANPLTDEGVNIVAVSQGLAGMTAGTRQLLDDIEEEAIWHDGHPVMSWCLSNCAADQKADGMIRFSKKHSSDKIDGAVALAIARGRGLANMNKRNEPAIYF